MPDILRTIIITGGLLTATLVFSASCEPAGFLFSVDGKIECGGDGEAIILNNNPAAINPTYEELIAFIKKDTMDSKDYIENGPRAYVCADFAEEVHNNAEAAGIKAGWVGVTFVGIDEGHAINAFETIDESLVYIDCTNGRSAQDGDKEPQSWDTIAYIKTGMKYGIIHVDRAKSLQYDYYLEYEKAWHEYKALLESYNKEVDKYNREISGKVYTLGSPEEIRINAWKAELAEQEEILISLEEELGSYWYESEYSSYVVENVLIHW
jgi:hypothetical protein